jgi:NAD(P)H dehydrogenase (quinone)
MLLVTGANGKLGRSIVEELLRRAPEGDFAVSVRDTSAAADLAERGVEVRQGDYDDPGTLRTAFRGVDRLLLMPTAEPNREAQLKVAVEAAVEAGVTHIVYPGAHAADRFDSPLLGMHKRIEDLIKESGAAWTFLRNAIYADVIASDVQAAVQFGELAVPAGSAVVAPVLRRDLAIATVAVLTGEGHEGKVYELTGSDVVGWAELAGLASKKAGKPIGYRAIDDQEAEARLRGAGLPDEHVGALLSFYAAYRAGWCGTPSADFELLTGRKATPSLQAIEAVIDGTAH